MYELAAVSARSAEPFASYHPSTVVRFTETSRPFTVMPVPAVTEP